MYRILSINPGSTSTKFAVYEDEKEIFKKSCEHSPQDLAQFDRLTDQLDWRRQLITDTLKIHDIPLHSFSAVVGRGGTLPPVKTGGYRVNEAMKNELIYRPKMEHASNLGALIAEAIAAPLQIPAYIYDAVVSDELLPEARITGFREITRQSFCHVLNSRAMAIKAAARSGRQYQEMNYIVAHLGGGISISAHQKGRLIDSISDDAGPFSPTRSGSVNLMYLVDLCFSGKYTQQEIMRLIRGEGGLKAHLGTHDLREIEKMTDRGDSYARLIYDAQALQIAKGISTLAGVFKEPADAVILTGGLAFSEKLTHMICAYIQPLLPVIILPGENEMEALAMGCLRILKGEEEVHAFTGGEDQSGD